MFLLIHIETGFMTALIKWQKKYLDTPISKHFQKVYSFCTRFISPSRQFNKGLLYPLGGY
jgi:hypothetical protein